MQMFFSSFHKKKKGFLPDNIHILEISLIFLDARKNFLLQSDCPDLLATLVNTL